MVGSGVGQELSDEPQQLGVGLADILAQPREVGVTKGEGFVLQELRAHLNAAEVVLQVMGENSEQFILVLGEALQAVARGFQGQMRSHS